MLDEDAAVAVLEVVDDPDDVVEVPLLPTALWMKDAPSEMSEPVV